MVHNGEREGGRIFGSTRRWYYLGWMAERDEGEISWETVFLHVIVLMVVLSAVEEDTRDCPELFGDMRSERALVFWLRFLILTLFLCLSFRIASGREPSSEIFKSELAAGAEFQN